MQAEREHRFDSVSQGRSKFQGGGRGEDGTQGGLYRGQGKHAQQGAAAGGASCADAPSPVDCLAALQEVLIKQLALDDLEAAGGSMRRWVGRPRQTARAHDNPPAERLWAAQP